MKTSHFITWLISGILLLLSTACTLTPHANVGLNLDYSGGEFHVRPSAQVGVYGRP